MKKRQIVKLTAAALCIIVSISCLFACGKKTDDFETTEVPKVTEKVKPVNYNPLTGIADLDADAIGKRPIAVMVENHPQARPQWGLCTPDIVIEGEVEGGITRMMWLYSKVSNVAKIGPTRSARHDYVELAEGLDAIYVHFGGSDLAYNKIKADSVNSVDGITNGSYFARDRSRKVATEHTAYTTGENIMSAISKKAFRTDIDSSYSSPFKFASEKRTLAGGVCNSVLTVFSNDYKHTFKYNTEDGLYYNYMNTKEMKDADGSTMAVNNVIILYTNVIGPIDAAKHVDWDLKGGNGVLVSNGTYENITWTKGDDAKSMLKLKGADGSELELNQGKSWIGFIRNDNAAKTVIS